VKRIKDLGLLPSIFGPYAYYHGDKLIPAFGEKRLESMFAARSFLDSGVKIAAHSDHPCAPFNPFMAIHALVNRTTKLGKPIGRSQRITVIEALKLYTIYAAYHSFDENMYMVVLSDDILTIPPEQIIDISVEMTIVEGETVYKKQ
jgi:predicted amidohydrolase YtcJ